MAGPLANQQAAVGDKRAELACALYVVDHNAWENLPPAFTAAVLNLLPVQAAEAIFRFLFSACHEHEPRSAAQTWLDEVMKREIEDARDGLLCFRVREPGVDLNGSYRLAVTIPQLGTKHFLPVGHPHSGLYLHGREILMLNCNQLQSRGAAAYKVFSLALSDDARRLHRCALYDSVTGQWTSRDHPFQVVGYHDLKIAVSCTGHVFFPVYRALRGMTMCVGLQCFRSEAPPHQSWLYVELPTDTRFRDRFRPRNRVLVSLWVSALLQTCGKIYIILQAESVPPTPRADGAGNQVITYVTFILSLEVASTQLSDCSPPPFKYVGTVSRRAYNPRKPLEAQDIAQGPESPGSFWYIHEQRSGEVFIRNLNDKGLYQYVVSPIMESPPGDLSP